jgi:murein L,D-transpeptidase YcbB/YkuD
MWQRGGWIIAAALMATRAWAQEAGSFAMTARNLAAAAAPARAEEREALARLYGPAGARPLWCAVPTGPSRQALAALDVLDAAETRGLPAGRYGVDSLRALAASGGTSVNDAARFDVALSRAIVRLVADLHMGRVAPAMARFDLPNVHDRVDLAALVTMVAQSADVAAAVSTVEPPYAGYRALERALARYRALAADTTLRAPRRATRTIRPGDTYADAPALSRLLVALGDLDPDAARVFSSGPAGSPRYDGALVDAVVRFQQRHGVVPDSAIGPATMAALAVPLARRVRQIELTLERWRWLPDSPPDRYVVVNIPAFRLYAFEHDSTARQPLLAMNVIVGDAEARHDTPVFTGVMREVVFRPYWDVPPSIARKELIPQFRRRPESFDAEGFEIVRRSAGDVPTTTFAPTAQNFARVLAGDLRLRQRPGPGNALGFVKFVFPNPYNVYLHGTPAQSLFAESRRDFSHGCIRTEHPTELAELVLSGQSPWDRQAMDSVMNGDRTVHVPIVRPVTVFVLYATAVVDGAGEVRFYPDLYRHDVALDRMLGLPPVRVPPTWAPPR